MTNSNNNDMFSDNSLDLARMYGFDPYNMNNNNNQRMRQDWGNNDDVLNQIYKDEAKTKNTDAMVDPETGKLVPKRPRMVPANQNSVNVSSPPPQGNQTFPTQHGEQTATNTGSMMQNSSTIRNMQSNNMQNSSALNQNRQEGTSQNMPNNDSQMIIKGATDMLPRNMRDINSFMRTQIGKNTTVQSIVGTDTLVEKSGVLLYVAQDYIILNENIPGDNLLLIEIPTIKFIRFE